MGLRSNRPTFPVRTEYCVCGLGDGRFVEIGIVLS